MERYLTESITEYWLRLPVQYKEKLSHLRVCKNLRMATDTEDIWVRGITPEELHSKEIRSIPFKKIYYPKDGYLFLLDGNLPEKQLKTSWLWLPIHKALPLETPDYNFNYFGVSETVAFTLVPSETPQESKAMLVCSEVLKNFICTAPEVRLQPLQWTLIDNNCFIFGTPLLPIPGKTFWIREHFFLPTGYDVEFPELHNSYEENLQVTKEEYIVFQTNNTFFRIHKNQLTPLSISSFRRTL